MDITRRRILLGAAGLPLALAGCGSGGRSVDPAGGPNVLMIAVDDLNDWVGFLDGHPQVQTPNLDRLAARSTVFHSAHCSAPVCNPSRASALSGLSVQNTKVFDNQTNIRNVTPRAENFHERIAQRGYRGISLGKIEHVYQELDPRDPFPDTTPATNKTCAGNFAQPQGLFDWAPLDIEDSRMVDHRYVTRAIDFLQQPHNAPFLLNLGIIRTHVAWYLPRKWFDLYPLDAVQVPDVPADDLDDLPQEGRDTALIFQFHRCITDQGLWASAVRAYLASISFADQQIGRLLDALDASPHAANTAVVLWSDHGWHLGEKFHWHKLALWERCTRVPMLIRMPGQVTGQTVNAPVSLLDLAPTMYELTGIDPPYSLDGRSLLPLVRNPSQAWNHPVLTTKDQHNHAIRTADWRYIRYRNGGQELYDERNDPGEFVNLAGDTAYAGVVAELDALMPPRPMA